MPTASAAALRNQGRRSFILQWNEALALAGMAVLGGSRHVTNTLSTSTGKN